MTNDAKLGLLAGIVSVVLVAVVYFPKPATGSVGGRDNVAIPSGKATPTVVPSGKPVHVSLTSRSVALAE